MRLTVMGMLIAILVICSKIQIPIGLVPVTLQTLAIFIIAYICNPKESFWTILTYIIMGIIGIPVFASGGGLSYIMQPSAGYLLGFLLACPMISHMKSRYKTLFIQVFSGFLGLLIIYAIGITYFLFIQRVLNGMSYDGIWIINSLVLTYLPTDVASIVIACYLSARVYPYTLGKVSI